MKRSRRQVLGQHFLHDTGILLKIVRAIAPGKDDLVIEVGPGRGALTFLLAERAGRVVALEKDGRLVPGLRERAPANLEVIETDVLQVSFRDLSGRPPSPPGKVILAGNLPYAISSPLMFKMLEEREVFHLCLFLLQKEFAQRICARPGSKQFAPLSILTQIHFEARILFTVPPAVFSPPPRVDSALLRLDKRPRSLHILDDEAGFLRFLQAEFHQRRKTLANNLLAAGFAREAMMGAFRRTGLEPRVRAEALPSELHVELYRELRPFRGRRRALP